MKRFLHGGRFALGVFFGFATSLAFYLAGFIEVAMPRDPSVLGAIAGAFLAGLAAVSSVFLAAYLQNQIREKEKKVVVSERFLLIHERIFSVRGLMTFELEFLKEEVTLEIGLSTSQHDGALFDAQIKPPLRWNRLSSNLVAEDIAFAQASGATYLASRLGKCRNMYDGYLYHYGKYSELYSKSGLNAYFSRAQFEKVGGKLEVDPEILSDLLFEFSRYKDCLEGWVKAAEEAMDEFSETIFPDLGIEHNLATKKSQEWFEGRLA